MANLSTRWQAGKPRVLDFIYKVTGRSMVLTDVTVSYSRGTSVGSAIPNFLTKEELLSARQ